MIQTANPRAFFDSLYADYYAMVLQMSLGYMKGDRQLAKDMTQEVFINVWNALPKFRNDASPKTWIYRITVNTCLLYIRDNKKKQVAELDESVHDSHTPASEHNPEEHAALYRAIGELPSLDRLIMMLVLEEIPYDEIAKITGINSINLRVKIHRIKKKMNELLKTEING
ncbi:MAG: sigma-70 family RNA polymerase sigma factor [Chitinophagaceae bacterium]|nr:MAG: sigma-70 family RNA polymerase sigma factor [Chitinophagaceae bacterium]